MEKPPLFCVNPFQLQCVSFTSDLLALLRMMLGGGVVGQRRVCCEGGFAAAAVTFGEFLLLIEGVEKR